jgi:hypothetical protein
MNDGAVDIWGPFAVDGAGRVREHLTENEDGGVPRAQ